MRQSMKQSNLLWSCQGEMQFLLRLGQRTECLGAVEDAIENSDCQMCTRFGNPSRCIAGLHIYFADSSCVSVAEDTLDSFTDTG